MIRSRPVGDTAGAALSTLQSHSWLGAAPVASLQDLMHRSSVVTVPSRELLFRQGETGRSAGVMLSGHMKLSLVTGNGREVVLEICGPGSLFGELAVLNGWPRSADATALSDSEVLSIPWDAFRATLTRSPELMFTLLGILSRRLRLATEQVTDGAGLPGPARLAKALGQLAAMHGTAADGGLQIDLALSQGELGGLTGLTRETINRHLTAWRERGWLEISNRHVTLLNAEALRRVVDEAADG